MNKIAVIDIGSNSVRYMEAECTPNGVHSLRKVINTTRLAQGQGDDKRLQNIPMIRTAKAVLEFQEIALQKEIPVYAYATSALRESSNNEEFLSIINGNINIDILSGEMEGKLGYLGASKENGTVIDIGGGSFQIVNHDSSVSFPIGCVRLSDRINGNPEQLYHYLCDWADCVILSDPYIQFPVTGIGGTITTLGALSAGLTEYDSFRVSQVQLTPAIVNEQINELFNMGDDRKNHPLLTKRYSVILPGAIILKYLMTRYSINKMRCSDRDGMEGYAEYILSMRS